jgi:hypothetical protein
MDEPPANWKQQDDNNSTVSSTTVKFSELNVNAAEFSAAPKPPTVPKTSSSIPVAQQRPKEPITTAGERERYAI